jgi:hypothetical protein
MTFQEWFESIAPRVKGMKPGDILRISMFDAFEMQEDRTLRIIATNMDGRKVEKTKGESH